MPCKAFILFNLVCLILSYERYAAPLRTVSGTDDSAYDKSTVLSRRNLNERLASARFGPACLKMYDSHKTAPGSCMLPTYSAYNPPAINVTYPFLKLLSQKEPKIPSKWNIFRLSDSLLSIFMRVLNNSVDIISYDDGIAEMYEYIRVGKKNHQQDMYKNQHSSELWFPFLLRHHPRSKSFLYNRSSNYQNDESDYTGPLFHYVESHVYTFNAYALDERYLLSNPIYYWEKFLPNIVNTQAWKICFGLDYIVPASHPLTPLNINDKSFDLNVLAHATFLVVDYDMKGRYPKDTLIPYVSDSIDDELFINNNKSSVQPNQRELEYSNHERKVLLMFIGKDTQYVRHQILTAFSTITASSPIIPYEDLYRLSAQYSNQKVSEHEKGDIEIHEIMISDVKISNTQKYYELLFNTQFCLMIRGDTTSSSRLFNAIAFGCIPIIVSDWIILPYEKIIQYHKFTISIEESFVINHSSSFLEYIRSIPVDQINQMKYYLNQAKSVLLYHSLHEYNPLSLMLIDNLMNRVIVCANVLGYHRNQESHTLYDSPKNSLCQKLLYRFQNISNIHIFDVYDQIMRSQCYHGTDHQNIASYYRQKFHDKESSRTYC